MDDRRWCSSVGSTCLANMRSWVPHTESKKKKRKRRETRQDFGVDSEAPQTVTQTSLKTQTRLEILRATNVATPFYLE